MPEPTRFTAPVTGRYHFASGREPHLESECTGGCLKVGGPYSATPDEIRAVEIDVYPPSPANHPDNIAAFIVYVQEKCRGAPDDAEIPVDLGTARAIVKQLEAALEGADIDG